MSRFRKWLPLVIVLAALALMFLLASLRSKPPQREARPVAPLVEVLDVAVRPQGFELRAQGSVQPRTQTSLVSEVSGNVIEVSGKFAAGGVFRRGELLLRIDPKDYEVAVARAEAQLANRQALLQQEQARAEQAVKDWRSIGRGEPSALALRKPYLAEAEANVHAAEADLRAARIDLERTRIRAPFDGLLRDKQVDLGQFVSRGTPLAVLAAVDVADIRLPLTEAELALVDIPDGEGLPVRVESRAAGRADSWRGMLVRSEGVLDERTRVLHVVAEVQDPYGLLPDTTTSRPLPFGSFVDVHIPGAQSHPVIAVPREALRGMDQVMVVDGEDRLRLRRIEILRSDVRNVYIAAGIEAGERLVTTVIEAPVEGMSVRVVVPAAEPAPPAQSSDTP